MFPVKALSIRLYVYPPHISVSLLIFVPYHFFAHSLVCVSDSIPVCQPFNLFTHFDVARHSYTDHNDINLDILHSFVYHPRKRYPTFVPSSFHNLFVPSSFHNLFSCQIIYTFYLNLMQSFLLLSSI